MTIQQFNSNGTIEEKSFDNVKLDSESYENPETLNGLNPFSLVWIKHRTGERKYEMQFIPSNGRIEISA